MKLEINPRGNGACPLCMRTGSCKIKKAMSKALFELPGLDPDAELEVVVYACPQFKEIQ
jgi:hypothetical protein